jgi:radical SAM-linked protein
MRFRIRFQKTNAMRFTGHLDLHKAWERTLRRAALPLAYSQGFHPQPKINLACALPLGFTSDDEMVDIRLEREVEPEEIQSRLQPSLPPGIRITAIEAIDLHEPALQTQVQSAEYCITMLVQVNGLKQKVDEILASKSLLRNRRGKEYDLRPLIEEIQILPDEEDGKARLAVRLAAREGATGRPEELISALGYDPFGARYHRTRLVVRDKLTDVFDAGKMAG